jgi:hypothetical protein
VAIFVMLAGVVVMVRLFHTSLRYQTLVDNQSTAVMLAEREMERVRGWSRKNHTSPSAALDFNNFLTDNYPGKTAYQDPDHPGFQIQSVAIANAIYSPCSLFELLYPAAERRVMRSAACKIKVTVRWGWDPYNSAPLKHELTSLVAWPTCKVPPSPPANPTVTGAGSSIPQGGPMSVTVSAINTDSQALGDLFYEYIVQPGEGNQGGGFGSVSESRDGRAAVLHNYILSGAVPPVVTGYGVGKCNLRARARYRGYIVEGVKTDIDMLP